MIVKNEKLNSKQKQINARRVLDLLKMITGEEGKHEKNRNIHKGIDKLSRS